MATGSGYQPSSSSDRPSTSAAASAYGPPGFADRAAERRREGRPRDEVGQERAVAEWAGGGEGAPRPLLERAELQPVDAVAGQLHEQGHRLGVTGPRAARPARSRAVGGRRRGGRARSRRRRREKPGARGLPSRPPEQTRDSARGRRGRRRVSRRRAPASARAVHSARCSAAGALSGRRSRAVRNQRAAPVGARGTSASPASRSTAMASAVARPRGRRDVVRPHGRGGPARAEAFGDSFVRPESPSAGSGPRRRRGGRVGGGSGSGVAPLSTG